MPVALHDGRTADLQFITFTKTDFQIRKSRPHGMGMVVMGFINGNNRRGFRHPVTLHDVDAQSQEGFGHIRGEGGAARNKQMNVVAENRAKLAADLLVEKTRYKRIQESAAGRFNRQPVGTAEPAPAHFDSPVKEILNNFAFLGEPVLQLVVDHFVHTRNGHQYRRTNLTEIFLQRGNRAVKGCGKAETEREVVGRRSLKGVRERQKGEKRFMLIGEHLLQNASDIGEDISMGEHHALGRTGGSRGIHERSQIRGLGTLGGQLRRGPLTDKGFERHHGNRGFEIVAVLVVRNHDELQCRELGGFTNLFPFQELIRNEHLGSRVIQNKGRGFRRVNGMQRNGDQGIGERREVEKDRFRTVRQQHGDTVTALERRVGGKSMTPVVHLIIDIFDREIFPAFLSVAVDLIDHIIRANRKMMGQQLGERREKVQLFNTIFGDTRGLVVCTHSDSPEKTVKVSA
ncbi:hypothetical protein EVA_02288 [gut metagenome]|uniref:Uncharacterized protein n=1 Tax=gut metagenome TaxID=749906 RepID=J9H1J0_9ZZZZ